MSETTPTPASEPKVIKRYTNRKLYDTVESRYVTLEEIAEMVKAGAEVRIVDNRTKEDLTSVTLAQIIFEEEKKTSKMPLGMLRDIIRTGGDSVQSFFSGQVVSRVQNIKEEAEQLRDRLFKREAEQAAAAATAPAPAAAPEPVEPPPAKEAESAAKKLSPKELVSLSQKAMEEWQRKLDERIRNVVEGMASIPALAKDLHDLDKRIAELEKKLDELK